MGDEDAEKRTRIRELLQAIDNGTEGALDELVTVIYPDLKRLAHYQLGRERQGHTLNTTAIVHEAFVRLASSGGSYNDRGHFLRAAATVMRHLLVDHARKRNAEKRGDGVAPLTLQDERLDGEDDTMAVLAMDAAMKDIGAIDERLVQIIECRYFAGLTVRETAEALDMSVRSVERSWQRARAYLIKAMETDDD